MNVLLGTLYTGKKCYFYLSRQIKLNVSSQLHVPWSLRERNCAKVYKIKKGKPRVRGSRSELWLIMAELLWMRREVVTVVPPDVGADAYAALAPPLVTVSSQTGKSTKINISITLPFALWSHSYFKDSIAVLLPGLDVLRHNAPR